MPAGQTLTKTIQMQEKEKFETEKLNQDILSFASPPNKKKEMKDSDKIFNKSPHIVVKKTKLKSKKVSPAKNKK